MLRAMPVYRLPKEVAFPSPDQAEPEGLLAVGGDLSPARLLTAYAMGIFPWYSQGDPILWWSPDPRMVLWPAALHVPRSLRKFMRKSPYRVTFDRAFTSVMRRCSVASRPGQDGTWITDEMVDGYSRLHVLGFAHSVEVWDTEGDLVGGLYGVALGSVFAGESMFASADNASKVGFVRLVEWLRERGCRLIDCQMHTEHLARFGAAEIPRTEYLEALQDAVQGSGPPQGRWSLESDEPQSETEVSPSDTAGESAFDADGAPASDAAGHSEETSDPKET